MPPPRRCRLGLPAALILLLTACGGTGSDAVSSGARDQQQTAGAPSAITVKLPTAAEVEQAVAVGVGNKELPSQPPDIRNPGWQDHCEALREETSSSVCIHGDTNGTHLVVVYGDSHAGMWIPSFDAIGKQIHWKVAQLSKQACQVADFPRYNDIAHRPYTECDTFRAFALEQIRALHPDVLVLTSAFKDSYLNVNGAASTNGIDDAWRAGLDAMIKRLAPLAGRIVLLGDIAYPNEAGRDCLSAHPHDVLACNTPLKDGVFVQHNRMEQDVANANGITYVDVIPWFCTDAVCPAVVGGLATHWDKYHVALNYALWLSAALGDAAGLLKSAG
jgi:hypothetical protein